MKKLGDIFDKRKPRRYRRLDFVNEAAFSRVWSVRFTHWQAIALGAVAVAAVAALVYVVMAFTPLRRLLPGTLPGDMRGNYVEATMRLDELSQSVRSYQAYIDNLEAILSGTVDPDSALAAQGAPAENTDTLLTASDAERAFVQAYESSQRYNLSVLTPIAAEAMGFYSPTPGAEATPTADGRGTHLRGARGQGVDAVYRGSVVAAFADAKGLYTVIIQHPNEFISVYSGLADCYVKPGATPATGARIGQTPPDGILTFELWHKGSALNPADYVAF